MTTPTIISRQEGEAWKRPFIALYEPFNGDNNFTVERIERLDSSDAGNFSAVQVFNKNNTRQIILQACDTGALNKKGDWQFQGSFGVISTEENNPFYLYLGEGKHLSYKQYTIESKASKGSINLLIDQNKMLVSCNQESILTIRKSRGTTATLVTNGKTIRLSTKRTGTTLSFTVPAVKDGELQIQ